MEKNSALGSLMRMRSPKRIWQIFDLVCVSNYFDGRFGNKMSVDDSREVFRHILKLAKKQFEQEQELK